MQNLWFPVKLGPTFRSVLGRLALGAAMASTLGCGYHPAYGGERPTGRLAVVVAPARAPESGALAGVLAGLRGELSRAGVLEPGSGRPRVVVELVRVEERGTAQTLANPTGSGLVLPLASGALVGVTARAWVESPDARVGRDTGDVRRTAAFAAAGNPGLDAARREAALSEAGKATGAALGRRILGEVEVAQEPM